MKNKGGLFSKMNKKQQKTMTTYLIVIIAYVVLEIFMKAGIMSSHIKGLLVPMIYYAIAAVALNLCVGILGELSLGHAGFMCVGAYVSSILGVLLFCKDKVFGDPLLPPDLVIYFFPFIILVAIIP